MAVHDTVESNGGKFCTKGPDGLLCELSGKDATLKICQRCNGAKQHLNQDGADKLEQATLERSAAQVHASRIETAESREFNGTVDGKPAPVAVSQAALPANSFSHLNQVTSLKQFCIQPTNALIEKATHPSGLDFEVESMAVKSSVREEQQEWKTC